MSNTCSVDNLLMMTYIATEHSHVLEWFEKNAGQIRVLQVVLDIFSLFRSNHFEEGRAMWLSEYCKVITVSVNWNVWGGEAERFVEFFAAAQETVTISSCSKRRCPVGQKRNHSKEILLGLVFCILFCVHI